LQAQSAPAELAFYGDADSPPLDSTRYPDVYYTAGYGFSSAIVEDGRWRCAAWEDRIVLPYVERHIDGDSFDAVSPYGYCGLHVADNCSENEVVSFWREVRERWHATGLVTMFFRFSPMDLRAVEIAQRLESIELTRRGDTILVPVGQGANAAWKAMEGRARTAIRKAEKAGLTARVREVVPADLIAISDFRRLYEATMVRVGSNPKYLFADQYYGQLLDGLGPALLMAEVRDADGAVVACSLVMVHNERAHYHLAGSSPEGARMGANNLLVWTIIRWAAEHGKSVVHLGGGLTADDKLFAFKKSFGGHRAEFWTGTAVLDEDRYRRLIDNRSARLGVPRQKLTSSSFFPLYRAEFGRES
jgi:serine/alanine adding enzyme